MKPFPIGNDIVVVIFEVPQLDAEGKPLMNAYGKAEAAELETPPLPGCRVKTVSSSERVGAEDFTDTLIRTHIPWGVFTVPDEYIRAWLIWANGMPGRRWLVQGDFMPKVDLDGDFNRFVVEARSRKG